MSFLKAIFGDESEKAIKRLKPRVEEINALEEGFAALSDEALKGKTLEFKERLAQGASMSDILPEAFSAVREAARRTLKQRHFDVQLLGGMVMHTGGIAEMRTGEGKTLVATLPAYLNALSGNGVHVVTVNDYLASRDAVWMGQIYSALGLTVGVLNSQASYIYDPEPVAAGESVEDEDKERDTKGGFHVVHEFLRPASREEAYRADITYGTNSEFGFDYLRDNLEYDQSRLRQRGHAFAIVDEIDSILIDEARTPLIISAPVGDSENLYAVFSGIASRLKEGDDYSVDEKLKAITLLDGGIAKAESALGVDNIYTEKGIKYVHHLETAVKAKALYKRDKAYVVKDGQVIIVDEFTGRLQPGRRWSEGLHQAVEAKEGVRVQEESRTYASITYQNYFRMYEKLSGMTGTAATSAEEFAKVYGLETVSIPPNKPPLRNDKNDLIFQTEAGKFKALARRVKELNDKGTPVLIGTASIEKNELLSAHLKAQGVKHEVLNAKNHEREGEIIAQAGRKGAVTIATNMAGRGVDIKLGGNPNTPETYEEIKSLGGLCVIGTERHEARRIDNQLRGRSGRQGDPGETQFFVSLGDDLMRVFASDSVKNMMGRLGIAEDEPIENRFITSSLEKAQERIEGMHFDARKHVLEFDNVLNFQRKTIYERRRRMLLGSKEDVRGYLNEIAQGDEEIAAVISKKEKELGDAFFAAVRQIVLQTIDLFWVEHLETMEYARGSVNLRAYGQREPLVEYKREGLRLFKEMEASIQERILSLIPNIAIEQRREGQAKPASIIANLASYKDIGRNDPCPCGAVNPETGKPYKYKQCGLINAPHHKG